MRKLRHLAAALCGVAFATAQVSAEGAPRSPGAATSPAVEQQIQAALQLADKDPVAARALMEKTAATRAPDAMAALAGFMLAGVGKPRDPEGGRRLLERAAAAGSNVARANLAMQLIEESDPAGWPRALDLAQQAQADSRLSSVVLHATGVALLFGRGVARNETAGIDRLEMSVKLDPLNPQALYWIGTAYERGLAGRPRDPARAADFFKRAADLGERRAMRSYGMALLQGDGVVADGPAAARIFRQAAEAGHRTAMVDLAAMLATGEAGTSMDPAQARLWYEKAALLGSAHALASLGYMLCVGEGGAADLLTGWAYLELAAAAGETRAQQAMQQMAAPSASSRPEIDKVKADWKSAPLMAD